ncbi:hypothetical protein [Mariniluteicoccus flavus]
MSSRIRSDFGSLGQRVARTPATHHVEVRVDSTWHPGLLVDWIRVGDLWAAHVAWVDGGLHSAIVAAADIRPKSTSGYDTKGSR